LNDDVTGRLDSILIDSLAYKQVSLLCLDTEMRTVPICLRSAGGLCGSSCNEVDIEAYA
jgi:hypothetical protein